MPGNRLAFAVFICCEQKLTGVFKGRLQLAHCFVFASRDSVIRLEVVFDVDREFGKRALELFCLRRQVFRVDQISDVPDRGQDCVVVAKILSDRLCLCRRLDDDQFVVRSQ